MRYPDGLECYAVIDLLKERGFPLKRSSLTLFGVILLILGDGCVAVEQRGTIQSSATESSLTTPATPATQKPKPDFTPTPLPFTQIIELPNTPELEPAEVNAITDEAPAGSGPSEEELSKFLIENTPLNEGTSFIFIRLEPDLESDTQIIVFFTSPALQVQRGIIQASHEGLLLAAFEGDPCYCDFLHEAYSQKLVKDQQEFIITSHSPHTGTCVGFDTFRVLSIDQGVAFREIWSEDTFSCGGQQSEAANLSIISDITFIDLDNDKNFEIIQKGRVINCGDACCCREGSIEEEFQKRFKWDEETSTFAEISSE